ncbi:MAG: hypothetical protein HFE54_01985 [Turicibacter sp.]|nr:hypothetical protein [Turicibacter sp.]MCI9350691.1 hypothetical protein [Turicibacter sp.]NCE78639.1 hypothetical protein [Turicibacter sp. TS3]
MHGIFRAFFQWLSKVNEMVSCGHTNLKTKRGGFLMNVQSHLLNDTLRQQLATVLKRMETKVTLVTIVDPHLEVSLELRDFVLDLANLGDQLEAIVKMKGEDVSLEQKIRADKFPVVALLDEKGRYSGVKFHAVPGGQEINAFLLAIYNLAGPGQAIDERTLEAIRAIRQHVNLKVVVSLSSRLCPDVVVAATRIAIENPNVEAEMIDLAHFPHLQAHYQITAVPCLILNDDHVYFGAKTMDQLLQLIS